MNVNITALLGSEIALSLYPQLIKLVQTTLESQIAIRFITYVTSASVGLFITGTNSYIISDKLLKNDTIITGTHFTWKSGFMYIIMGIINIFHVASSYYSFKILPSGISYTLFYTYPIFNILGQTIFKNEKINTMNYLYIAISIIGVYLIYNNKDKNDTNKKEQFITINDDMTITSETLGMFSGIISAFTESLIYYMVKTDLSSVSPYIQILKTYLLGGILSVVYLIKQYIDNKLSLDWNYWITLHRPKRKMRILDD
jgi:drug/metabolite transporter (DMT)-like permease